MDRQWIAPEGGLFQSPDNWDPAGTPSPADVPVFDLATGGYTVTFAGNLQSGPFRIHRDVVTFDLGGFDYGVSGQPSVGALNFGEPDAIAAGELTLLNGHVDVNGAILLAPQPNTSGMLQVSAGASINAGGYEIGQLGLGRLLVERGGIATGGAAGGATLGRGAGSTVAGNGGATVTGFGSTWDLQGALTVARNGYGSLSVLDGGRVAADSIVLAADPTVASRADVLVRGAGSVLESRQQLTIGQAGSAFLTAIDGGRIVSNGVRTGSTATATSNVLLSGRGTVWSNTSLPFEIGMIGNASFTIADGAALSLVSGSFGPNSGASATPPVTTLRVTGAGSTLKATQTLNVGMFGETNLIVADGGALSATSIFFGTSPGPGAANLSIHGADSTVSLTQSLLLNRQNINITNGGTLVTGGASIATVSPDSAVTVRIAGHGSNWTSSGQFQVGQSSGGAAEVYLEDGGQLATTNLIIGGNPTSAGLVSVSGAGSRLRVTQPQNFMIGSQTNLPAELRVSDDGGVVSSARIQIAAAARLVLDGGGSVATLNNAPIDNGGLILHSGGTLGAGSISNNGEIHLRGHDATIMTNSLQNHRLLHGTGRVNGNVTNGPSGEMRVGRGDRLAFGNQLLAGTVNNAGRLTFLDGGEMEFNGSLTNVAAGVITFTGGGALHAFSPTTGVGVPVKNSGQVLFSAGTADFFPSLENLADTSGVIVSGNGTATFHGHVLHNAGEFRVSEGSTAVFFKAVTGAGQFAGGGAKFFEGGQSEVAALTSGGDTVVQAPAGVKVSRFAEGALSVRGTMEVRHLPNPVTNVVDALTIEGGGVLDLANSDLVIDTTDATQAAVLAQVEQYVASARNAAGGRWRGPGLTSSVAATEPLKTLALIASGDDVLVRFTYDGDANGDGKVNADDYFKIDSGFLSQLANPGFADGDFNYDDRVNADDYFLIDSAFLGQGDAIAAGAVAAIAAVPEPGTVALVALCGSIAIRRRR